MRAQQKKGRSSAADVGRSLKKTIFISVASFCLLDFVCVSLWLRAAAFRPSWNATNLFESFASSSAHTSTLSSERRVEKEKSQRRKNVWFCSYLLAYDKNRFPSDERGKSEGVENHLLSFGRYERTQRSKYITNKPKSNWNIFSRLLFWSHRNAQMRLLENQNSERRWALHFKRITRNRRMFSSHSPRFRHEDKSMCAHCSFTFCTLLVGWRIHFSTEIFSSDCECVNSTQSTYDTCASATISTTEDRILSTTKTREQKERKTSMKSSNSIPFSPKIKQKAKTYATESRNTKMWEKMEEEKTDTKVVSDKLILLWRNDIFLSARERPK